MMWLIQVLLAVIAIVLAWVATNHKSPIPILATAIGLLGIAFVLGFATALSRLP